MKKAVLLLTLFGFVACLLLGMYAGSHSFNPPSTSPTTTAEMSSLSQHTVVFVQVDSLQSREPRLQSIWSATYDTQTPYVFLLMLYPVEDSLNQPRAEKLAESFSINSKGEVSASFSNNLEAGGFMADGMVLVDQQGLARAIDWLGGIDLGGEAGVLDGNAAASHSAWLDDPQAVLQWQRRMVNAMCQKFGRLPTPINWSTLSDAIGSEHYLTGHEIGPIEEEWSSLVAKSGQVQCESGMLGD